MAIRKNDPMHEKRSVGEKRRLADRLKKEREQREAETLRDLQKRAGEKKKKKGK